MAGVKVLLHGGIRWASGRKRSHVRTPAAASSKQALEAPANLNFTGGDVFDPILGLYL